MARNGNIRRAVRISNILIAFIILGPLFVASFFLTSRITSQLTNEFAHLHGNEVASSMEALLRSQIDLSIYAARSPELVAWMADEGNLEKKERAFEPLYHYQDQFSGKNTFVAVEESGNFYSLDVLSYEADQKALYQLDPSSPDDGWYYATLQNEAPYMLNVDEDRLLETYRLWVNAKVVKDGQVLGVVGTGIHITNFLEELYKDHNHDEMTILIVDEVGFIQLADDPSHIMENAYRARESSASTTDDSARRLSAFLENEDLEEVLKIIQGDHEEKYELVTPNSKAYTYIGVAPLSFANWHVVTLFNDKEWFNISMLWPLLIAILFLLVVFVVLADWIFFNRILVPYEQMMEGFLSYAKGSRHHLEKKIEDDLGAFAQAVTQVLDEMKTHGEAMEEMVVRKEARLNHLYNEVPFGLFFINHNLEITYANPYLIKLLGYDTLDASLQALNTSDLLNKGHNGFGVTPGLMEEGEWRQEICLIRADGSTLWVEVFYKNATEEEAFYYEGIVFDIQVKKEYEHRLISMTRIDDLTGLFNRRYFNELAAKEIKNARRYEYDVSIVMYDIDKFKDINDHYGHLVGDQILTELSQLVKNKLRETDIVARWGGEEFIILMPHTHEQVAYLVADKLREYLERVTFASSIQLTCSFGVAMLKPEDLFYEWVKRADHALYRAKSFGRNRVETYISSMERYNFDEIMADQTMQSGNELIDDQHKQLFASILKLIEETYGMHHQNPMTIEAIYKSIIVHFDTEEKFLDEINYPQTPHHRQVHNAILDQMHHIKTAYEKGSMNKLEVITFLIEEVLLQHLSNEDRLFIKYYREKLKEN